MSSGIGSETPKSQDETLGELCDKLSTFCEQDGLPKQSADELLFHDGLNDVQRAWLREFCDEWDKAANGGVA